MEELRRANPDLAALTLPELSKEWKRLSQLSPRTEESENRRLVVGCLIYFHNRKFVPR